MLIKNPLKKNSYIFIIFLLISSVTFTTILKADVDQGINISPTTADIKLKTDQQYSGSFTLTNNEQTDINLQFKESEKQDGQIGNVHDLDWFSVTNTELVLKAQSQLIVNYFIKVPTDENPGYVTKFLIASLYNTNVNQTNFNIDIPFTVNVVIDSLLSSNSGTVIKNFNISNKLIFDSKAQLTLTLDNPSDGSISKPISHINIITPLGQIVFTSILNESLNVLTKEETYTITAEIPTSLFKDIGQYTAQVIVTDALTNKSAVEKVTFTAFNQLYVLLIIVIVIGIYILYRFFRGLIKESRNVSIQEETAIGIKRLNRRKNTK